MPFTQQEQHRILYHLGYLQASPNAASLQLGLPRPQQVLFVVQDAMGLLPEDAVTNVRRILSVMDGVETKLIDAQDRLAADSVGSIKLRTTAVGLSEPDALEREYCRWGFRLADILGVPVYPYSTKYKAASGVVAGSIPVSR